MKINGVAIEDTFAEAFPMKATRIVVTAYNATWAEHAARAMTGFATSVIACGCEAGIERRLKPAETPDGRPGVAVLLFTMSTKEMGKQVQNRVGQCVLTSPTSACRSAMPSCCSARVTGWSCSIPIPISSFSRRSDASRRTRGVRRWPPRSCWVS